MSSKILFLAPYPTNANIKDGMISRVKAIDSHFSKVERTYLTVSLVRNRKREQYKDGLVMVYNLNVVLHLLTVLTIIKQHNTIYSHSIYMLRLLWIFIAKDKNLVLDLHGVVPEEERDFNHSKLKWRYFSFIENNIFKKAKSILCVTASMKDYYLKKYPFFTGNYIIFSIMPDFLEPIPRDEVERIKVSNKEKVNVVYSGGSQLWQNAELMLQTIKSNQSPGIHYTILTGDPDFFINKVKEYNIKSEYVSVESRLPNELWKDYIAADYAFILRDDNLVNNVANPTKLVEYLYYGLIPIVLSPHIGDYKELGYEYISLKDFNPDLIKPAGLSQKNIEIVEKLIQENKQLNIRQILLPT